MNAVHNTLAYSTGNSLLTIPIENQFEQTNFFETKLRKIEEKKEQVNFVKLILTMRDSKSEKEPERMMYNGP